MRLRATLISSLTLLAAAAQAHQLVRPRASAAGATEKYIVRVPTDGKAVTNSFEVDVARQSAPVTKLTASSGGAR